MANRSPCPSPEQLRRFLLDDLPEQASLVLEGHLDECPDCGTTATDLHRADPLAALVGAGTPLPWSRDDGALWNQARIAELIPDLSKMLTPPPEGSGDLGWLGPYRIQRVLGVGGMGIVFLAAEDRLDRLVALKAMLPRLAADASARERFLREGRRTAKVVDDHIVPLFSVGDENGTPFLVMPFLQGKTLEEWLRDGRLPPGEVLRIGREVALGLAAAHQRGLVHRDVKPGNIWLEGEWARVKILDFGLARAAEGDDGLTQSGAIVGTPLYLAPEQAWGAADLRSDLFSLGVVLYRMGAGELPFPGGVLKAAADYLPRPPHEVNPALPRKLSDLVMRLLEKDPAKRPESARAVVEALQAMEREPAPSPPVPPPGARKPVPRRRRWFLAAAAAVLLAGIPLGWLYGPAAVRIVLNQGVLVIETDDKVVEVAVNGQEATIVDPNTRREIWVKAGAGEIEVKEKDGLHLFTKAFTLSREGKEIVNVRYELAKAAPPKGPPGESPFDRLDRKDVPEKDLQGMPEELVAVLWRSVPGRFGSDCRVAVSRDGRYVSVGRDGAACWWDVAAEREAHQVQGANYADSFSADGRRLLCYGWAQPLRVWDAETGKGVQHVGTNEDVIFHADFDPTDKEGSRALIAQRDYHDGPCTIRLWDLGAAKELRTYKKGHAHYVTGLAWSADGRRFVTSGDYKDHTLRVWDVDKENEVRRFEVKPDQPGQVWLNGVAFSSDGRHVLCCGGVGDKPPEQGFACLFDLEKEGGAPEQVFTHTRAFASPAFSPDGKTMAAAGSDGRIILWERPSGKKLREMKLEEVYPKGSNPAVAFAPDGRHLVVAHSNGAVYVLRLSPKG